jgi:hypothetical protein
MEACYDEPSEAGCIVNTSQHRCEDQTSSIVMGWANLA